MDARTGALSLKAKYSNKFSQKVWRILWKGFFGLLIIISVISFFSSCQNNVDSEDSYTIWTDLSSYSEFESTFGTTLNDGMYVRLEFTSSQWSQLSSSLTSEGRHSWTKSQIKDWLLGRGFGDSESTRFNFEYLIYKPWQGL